MEEVLTIRLLGISQNTDDLVFRILLDRSLDDLLQVLNGFVELLILVLFAVFLRFEVAFQCHLNRVDDR